MEGFSDTTLENALIGFAKLLRNVSYYPDGHPALNIAIQNSLELFNSVLQRDGQQAIVLTVKRQKFIVDDQPLLSKNPLPLALAERLFSHKVKLLTILPDLIDRHLLATARIISQEPATISAQGGVQELLEQQHVSTVWTNEIDLSAIRSRKHVMEQHKQTTDNSEAATHSGHMANSQTQLLETREASLQELLIRLQEILAAPSPSTETPFLHGLRQLTQALQQLMSGGDRQKALPVLQQLDAWIHNPQSPPRYVRVLTQAVASLSGKPLIDLLIDNASDNQQQHFVSRTVQLLPADEIVDLLIQRLSEELNHKLRKFLSQLLVTLGEAAFPQLISSLEDERWFVTRNAISILSENRNPQLVATFIPFLAHPDGRVAKEAIRALARIKTEEAGQALITQLETPNYEFPNQIILALGAQANPEAVPTLIKIACQKDPFLNQKSQVRDAIMALSEIGTLECSQALIELLERGKWVKRKEYNEIRCQAAAAMSNLNDSASFAALEQACQSSKRELASTARQALRQRSGT